MGLSERVLRTETDLLKQQKLVDYSTNGMTITTFGQSILEIIASMSQELVLMNQKEAAVAKKLKVNFCRIISNERSTVDFNKILGENVQRILNSLLPMGESVIAVTGGNTMATVSSNFNPKLSQQRDLVFVPARGGVGGSTLIQANSVSEVMALNTNGSYRSLYVPEHVSKETYMSLSQEPGVAEVIELMNKANCLLYSVGNAKIMAERRGLSRNEQSLIAEKNAVGEAFGCFFNSAGQVVFKLPRIGLDLDNLATFPYTIAIVVGEEKVEALKAYTKIAPVSNTWYVIDEGVANLVLNEESR
nr:sugar-binding domain-containing protein [Granulicatella balaenopterae]